MVSGMLLHVPASSCAQKLHKVNNLSHVTSRCIATADYKDKIPRQVAFCLDIRYSFSLHIGSRFASRKLVALETDAEHVHCNLPVSGPNVFDTSESFVLSYWLFLGCHLTN